MFGSNFPTVNPGDRPKAEDENALRRQVEALSNIQGINGLNSFGNQYRLPPRVSGDSTCNEWIDFEIVEWLPDISLTSGCEGAYVIITATSCCSSVAEGDEVVVWDVDFCALDLPIDLLSGIHGRAWWGKRPSTMDDIPCVYGPPVGSCLWSIGFLKCCGEEVYGR